MARPPLKADQRMDPLNRADYVTSFHGCVQYRDVRLPLNSFHIFCRGGRTSLKKRQVSHAPVRNSMLSCELKVHFLVTKALAVLNGIRGLF